MYIQWEYEWDERKFEKNWRKHDGITFELAIRIFDDESCLFLLDHVDEYGEQRWKAIRRVLSGTGSKAMLVVIHVYRESEDGEDIIRIISAREADTSERRLYQKQEVD